MAQFGITSFLLLSAMLTELCFSSPFQVYIVYMGSKRGEEADEIVRKNHEMLATVHKGSMERAGESHVFSYKHSFRGFAARLTKEQASQIAEMPGVVSVFLNTKKKLHTTHSWDFMGISGDASMMNIPRFSTKNQEDIIIGLIDTGIWPESPSFSDHGMSRAPLRWKGQCNLRDPDFPSHSSCNKKIIGARYYIDEALPANDHAKVYLSARDDDGHGSHTASIAAGRRVKNVSYNGLAKGTARGAAELARIAVYKACWDMGCSDASLLAAFDDAINDGVDILSVSLGSDTPIDYWADSISIGSYHAAHNGVLVVASAGNSFQPGTATNTAPWILTVAASSTDRELLSTITFENQVMYMGASLSPYKNDAWTGVIPAVEASNGGDYSSVMASLCVPDTLDSNKVRGKIIICSLSDYDLDSPETKSSTVKDNGGVGMILIDEMNTGMDYPFVLPAGSLGTVDGHKILLSLRNNRSKSEATISQAETVYRWRAAPRVAAFSSRGPSAESKAILKPDILAPGLNIIAAWSPEDGGLNYNIISGTSMSCPHISGLAALIKAAHPDWSPSAIKSAIMTSATTMNDRGDAITSDPSGMPGNPFDYGSGFPVPAKAIKPGLIFETTTEDYLAFLCSIYSQDERKVGLVTGAHSNTCSDTEPQIYNINYPSIALSSPPPKTVITRTMTNVGATRARYRAIVSQPYGVVMKVSPKVLRFSSAVQKLSFKVYIDAPRNSSKKTVFGSLTWRSKHATVATPIAILFD